MKNGKLAIFVTILFFLIFVGCYTSFIKTEKDNIKFKKEYEKYNNEVAYKRYKYQKLNISSNNPIKYASYDEIFDLIDNETGVIYLGFPNCPWCRTILPVFFEVMDDYKIDTVLYMNILNERSKFIIKNEKLVKEKDGTKNYYKLLKKLDKYLDEYIIEEDGKEYNTNEKRIYAPTIIFVKKGEIIGIHVSSIKSQENGFDKLTNNQKEELYEIYESYVLKLQDLVCSDNTKC